VLQKLPLGYTMTLLSATLPEDISHICETYMSHPSVVEIEKKTTYDRIEQLRYDISKTDKMKLLLDVTVVENPDSCMIFCNTRAQVDEIFETLNSEGYKCNRLHGGMEQDDRTKVMTNFRKGYFNYLVATDVAARGIDIDNISIVINYDLPEEAEVYVHRIGRTGRKDNFGKAISFVSQDAYLLKAISKLTSLELVLCDVPADEVVELHRSAFDEKMKKRPTIKHEKHTELNQEIMKLHINAGKKTKMRAGDVVGALCSIEGISQEDIGNISIIDVSTFVEILNNKGPEVFKALQKTPIKGRIRKVNKARA